MADKKCLTRKEAAAVMGIGLASLDAFLKRRDDPIPNIRVGRRVLISAAALDLWIEAEGERQAVGR